MKRTAILKRSTPLKRGAILKSSRPKSTPIRKSARDEECTLRFPGVCNHRTDTTVLCHSNALADGKGMGLKAPDTAACYGCLECHRVLDGQAPRPAGMTYETMQELFRMAVKLTHVRLRAKGLLKES